MSITASFSDGLLLTPGVMRFFRHATKHVRLLNHCIDSIKRMPADATILFALPDSHPYLKEMLNESLSKAGLNRISFEFSSSETLTGSASGKSGVFLLKSSPLDSPTRESQHALLNRIAEYAQSVTHRVMILPLIFLWNRVPSQNVYPSTLLNLLRFRRRMLLSFGSPISLEGYADSQHRSITRLHRVISMHRHREIRIITGHKEESTRALTDRLIKRKELQAAIDDLASTGRKPRDEMIREARKMIAEIAAEYRDWGPRLWDYVMSRGFSIVYSGIEFDFEGLHRFRNLLGAKKKVILAPCHRSHLDYVTLSYGCYIEGITPPLVAAGINLAFFPMGWLFRHTGAFFIRRSFKGQDLYPKIFRTYLIDLVHKFHPLEVFIEGGRSRSGRFRPPKLGFVGILIDAIRNGEAQDVQILPISLNYDRLLEEKSYLDELAGKPKQKETFLSMLKSRHLLKEKYGKIYVSFGDPISIRQRIDEVPDSFELKEKLGLEIVFQTAIRMSVTPVSIVATGLLTLTYSDPDRAVPFDEIINRCTHILALIKLAEPTLSQELQTQPDSVEPFIRALQFLQNTGYCSSALNGPRSYQVPVARRIGLDYLRNGLVGLYFPISLRMISDLLEQELGNVNIFEYLLQIFCPGFYPFPADGIASKCRIERQSRPFEPATVQAGLAMISPELLNLLHFRTCLEGKLAEGIELFEPDESHTGSASYESDPMLTHLPEVRTTDFLESLVRSSIKQKRISRISGTQYRIKKWAVDQLVASDRIVLEAVLRILKQVSL